MVRALCNAMNAIDQAIIMSRVHTRHIWSPRLDLPLEDRYLLSILNSPIGTDRLLELSSRVETLLLVLRDTPEQVISRMADIDKMVREHEAALKGFI